MPYSVRPSRVTESQARAVVSILLVTLALVASGCGPGGRIRAHLTDDVTRPQPGIVLFLVDGLPPRMVVAGCTAGWLPNIRTRFWEGGTRVEHAVTTTPSITYSAIAGILTGASPATHGIIGNRWFDPDELLFRNYVSIAHYRTVNRDFAAPTIYERIAPEPSTSIQAAHYRGVSRNFSNWAWSGAMWGFRDYTAVDKLTATSTSRVARWANAHNRWPTIAMFYMPGADSVGHDHGPSSPEFRSAVQHVDYQIGRVCDWLETRGLLESSLLVLVSDHGMTDVHTHVDLEAYARQTWRLPTTSRMIQDGPTSARRSFYNRHDIVVNHQDGRRASLHFRGSDGWQKPLPPTLVAAMLKYPPAGKRLWDLEGVELVAWLEAADTAVVRTRRGMARVRTVTTDGQTTSEYIPEPDDALGYCDNAALAEFINAGSHDGRAWLRAAADEHWPDVVPSLVPLFRLRRAGQVVLFAEPGYSFVHEKGGHGGVNRDDMFITMMFAGPGVTPGGTIDSARSVDLVPTLLSVLGQPPEDDDPWLSGSVLQQIVAPSTPATHSARAPSSPPSALSSQ